MNGNEIKLVQYIFTILPTFAIAISLAVMYVRWKKSQDESLSNLENMRTDIDNNKAMIVKVAKIHLVRHPDDAGNFIEKELV